MSGVAGEGDRDSRPPLDPARRHAARLAAVQALYQIQMSGAGIGTVIADFLEGGAVLDQDEAEAVAPDRDLLVELVRGVSGRRAEIDAVIGHALSADRRLDRLELILRCILSAGAYELLAHEARPERAPARMVINEYVDIAHAFYAGPEPALVNGVLDRLARTLRPGELEAGPRGSGGEGERKDGPGGQAG